MSRYIYISSSTLPSIGCVAMNLARTDADLKEEADMYARNDSSIARAVLQEQGIEAYEAYIKSMDDYQKSMAAKRKAKLARRAVRKDTLRQKKERLEETLSLFSASIAGKFRFSSVSH